MQRTDITQFCALGFNAANRLGLPWTLTWIVLCIDVVWLALGGWSVSASGLAVIGFALAAFLSPLTIGRYRRDLRIRTSVRAAALLIAFQAAAATLSYLVVSTNAPLVDAPLAAWDRAFGFDWPALHAWLQHHPLLQATLRIAYYSGLIQLTFVVLFLGFSQRPERLDEFMRLFIVATLLTILVSGLLPAAGAWKHHALAGTFDLSSLSHFELLRDGRLRNIPLHDMQGLISVPSLHVVMALLLVYAVRATKLLPVFAVLNAAMLASTPVDGGHYLVDVLAGAALAIGLIALERRRNACPRAAIDAVAPRGLDPVRQ